MYKDNLLTFANGQALTASGALTNIIDLGSDRKIGPGTPLWIVINILVALAGTTPTLKLALQTSDDSAFGTFDEIAAVSPTAADVDAGAMFVLGMPWTNKRYLRMYATLGGTTPTVTLSADLTSEMPYDHTAYPSPSQA
ncbi:Bbp16 family capsid cement protein [Paraburkholderia sp. SIMBA_027]|uniref:Bbp16 family capsid cement protein n=1 Tax=Paraburkholderia sp. SIMBA_027 TaxID=3085770 RepID=UPI00397A7746